MGKSISRFQVSYSGNEGKDVYIDESSLDVEEPGIEPDDLNGLEDFVSESRSLTRKKIVHPNPPKKQSVIPSSCDSEVPEPVDE